MDKKFIYPEIKEDSTFIVECPMPKVLDFCKYWMMRIEEEQQIATVDDLDKDQQPFAEEIDELEDAFNTFDILFHRYECEDQMSSEVRNTLRLTAKHVNGICFMIADKKADGLYLES